MFEQLGLIGCGLMGGSFALAARQAGLVRRVVGYSPSANTTRRALERGVVDAVAAGAADAAKGSDLILVAVPVSASARTFTAIRDSLRPDALMMDVGSTKRDVVEAARHALGERIAQFVPCHPMVGREVAGVENADAGLYAGGQVIITPIAETPPERITQAHAVWQALGCHTLQLTPESHDAALAAVSHLPHLIAFAFIQGVAVQPEGRRFLSLAGPGFRDFSRIAASNPNMWRDIFLTNSAEIKTQLHHFRAALDHIEQLIENGDAEALVTEIRTASAIRAHWSPAQPVKPTA
jgi:prephenate dehydrogenase